MSHSRRLADEFSVALVLTLLLALAGCGDNHHLAPVQGKITYQGQPVKGGVLTFQPLAGPDARPGTAGRPADAQVQDDGTFILSTDGQDHGAAIGKHRVIYTPFMEAAQSYDDKPAPSPYLGLVPKPDQIEVQPGPNEIDIELVPKS